MGDWETGTRAKYYTDYRHIYLYAYQVDAAVVVIVVVVVGRPRPPLYVQQQTKYIT